MLIFWQECKHILRSRFLWIVVILGSIFAVYNNTLVAANLGSDISFSYEFTEQHGVSYKEKDVEVFLDTLLEQHFRAQDLKNELKAAGIPKVTAKDIIDYAKGNDCEFTNQLMQIKNTDEKAYGEINNDLYPFEWIASGALSRNLEEYDVVEHGKNRLESTVYPVAGWKQEMLLDAFEKLQKRAEEITENQENQYFLPYSFAYNDNSGWFSAQFSGFSALGFVWGFSMVLAGIIAARSIGGSFLNHMSGILYCGKSGRKLALRKMVSVSAISGMLYLALSLLITIYYVYRFRLNLYWDVPLASMIQYTGPSIPRFPITVGGYWWFQLGVGLGTILIMALIFSAAMIFTKSFYGGSAISLGISLLLLGLVQMVPAVQSSFLLMGSPVGLFLQAGKFLQQDFLFSILPHFEGIMLLIWFGIAAGLGAVGFMRFRKASL